MLGIRLMLRRLIVLLLTVSLLLPAAMVGRPAQAQPAIPQLLSPSYGTITTVSNYPPTGTPTLVWQAVPGADYYNVQICPSLGCANPIVSRDTYANSYAYPETLADGDWYWWVRAHNSSGWSDYPAAWHFEKSWLNFGEFAPQLLTPAADATVEFFGEPAFTWEPVTGAAYYRFQIATDAGFSNIVHNYETIAPAHIPWSRRSRGDYYWRVIPVDYRNNQGTPSEVRHFFVDFAQVPTLLAPDDLTYQTFTPEFRWTAVRAGNTYHLQVSTVADFSTTVLDIWTNNTRYTPYITLENDREYYWRVAARDRANTEGPWSQVRSFTMQWHLVPRLLSPTFGYVSAPFPVFQWTPVASKQQYRLEVAIQDQSFNPPDYVRELPDPRFDHFNWGLIYTDEDYFWRVRSKKGNSETSWSQTSYFRWTFQYGPTLVYPPYYYDPALEPSTQLLDVRGDPTVPAPVFMWDRVLYYISDSYQQAADAYRVEVSDDPTFASLDWYTTTANLSAAPTVDNPFVPDTGVDYYWRVRPYYGGTPMGPYSERWVARFDLALQEVTPTIALYFPADGMDNVYDTPLFGWSPVQGAARYHFQIDTSPDFDSAGLLEDYSLYGFYTPDERLPAETYYWRVQAQDGGGTPIGSWSETRRVVIVHPLRVDYPAFLPLLHPISLQPSTTRIGQDPSEGGTPFDLTNLYLAADASFWYLTLDIPPTNTTDMYFVYYIDLDHAENSGGPTDPMGFNVQADAIYRPEVVLVAHHDGGGQISDVFLYRWLGSYWDTPSSLGSWDYERGEYLELHIPRGEFNVFDYIGTVSVEVFTASSGGQAMDTVPSEATTPTSLLTNFTAAADKLNPLHPWDNPFSNPVIYHTSPLVSFSKPLYRSWVHGYDIQVARDYAFTEIVMTGEWTSGTPPMYWFLSTRWGSDSTFEENDTLYWRVRIDHYDAAGPWSQPVRFTKFNFVPVTMTADYDYTTPTFHWDRVEGAYQYNIQYDDDPEFGSPVDATTDNPSNTTTGSIADGTWHWRIRVKDGSSRYSDWTVAESFTKRTPAPVLTDPINDVVVNEIPTFTWQDILYPTGSSEPVMAGARYHLIVDDDPNFSPPYIVQEWVQTNGYVPLASHRFDDGTYYWKVSMFDANNNEGPFSDTGVFYKAYLIPTPLSAEFDPVPNLSWEPLDGAAYYEVQICRDVNYSDCVESKSTDQTTYVSTQLYPLGIYYWRVRMCDRRSACGPYYEDKLASGYLIFLPTVFKDW